VKRVLLIDGVGDRASTTLLIAAPAPAATPLRDVACCAGTGSVRRIWVLAGTRREAAAGLVLETILLNLAWAVEACGRAGRLEAAWRAAHRGPGAGRGRLRGLEYLGQRGRGPLGLSDLLLVEELLELAGLEHLRHDVGTAEKLTLDV
jgi:hypothetical protein